MVLGTENGSGIRRWFREQRMVSGTGWLREQRMVPGIDDGSRNSELWSEEQSTCGAVGPKMMQ